MVNAPRGMGAKGSTRYRMDAETAQLMKRMGEERRYLARAEVAALMEASPSSVSRWARQGKLPSTRTIGGRRRYPKDRILRLIKEMMDAG